MVGFYMIATKIPIVYEVTFPEDVMRFLDAMSTIVTIGVDFAVAAAPFECVGLEGYTRQMLFWLLMPLITVLIILVGTTTILIVHQWRCGLGTINLTPLTVLYTAAPVALNFLFIVQPIVTRNAFSAFSFHETDEGSWLRTDVRIERGSPEHSQASRVAVIAILAYPVGNTILFGALLWRARAAILSGQTTGLSNAIHFLHGDYRPSFFWWELVEMSRRFILVGALANVRQGSVEQLAYGTIIAVIYLVIHLIASPYQKTTDEFLAASCSFFLVGIFIVSIFYKYSALTQLEDQRKAMSSELEDEYNPSFLFLSAMIGIFCVGALVALGAVTIVIAAEQAKRVFSDARAAKARRLHHLDGDAEIILRQLPSLDRMVRKLYPNEHDLKPRPPTIPHNGPFNIFLSHNWKHGQSEMRVIKNRLCEMLPDVSVFLDGEGAA